MRRVERVIGRLGQDQPVSKPPAMTAMFAPLTQLAGLARARGLRRAAYAVLRKLLAAPWWRRRVRLSIVEVFNVLAGDLNSPQRIPRVFQVRRAEPDDSPALQDYFRDPPRVRGRLLRGDVCVMTVAKEEICAAVWLAPGPNSVREDWDDLQCAFSFPAGVAWSYDGRGAKLGAWGSLMARLPHILHELRVNEIFALVDYRNFRSLDSLKSLGYRSLGLISCLQLFGATLRAYKPHGGTWRRLPRSIGKLNLSG
jgi:hypothetical protein